MDLREPYHLLLGCDPEGFFKRNRVIVGASTVLPPEGLASGTVKGAVSIDGVQFEIHTNPHRTPLGLAGDIAHAFEQLRAHLGRIDPQNSIKVVLDEPLVEVTRTELDRLPSEEQMLGCKPSRNIYGNKPILVDGRTYMKRSAGGHVALSCYEPVYGKLVGLDRRADLVALMDVFVGNTCVMFDQDQGIKERRENYGRAGEHRYPIFGVEYRTLSNFWLRSFPLMDMVFRLTRLAYCTLHTALLDNHPIDEELMDKVDLQLVSEAINQNDFHKARRTWVVVKDFIKKFCKEPKGDTLHAGLLDKFEKLVDTVEYMGLPYCFPEDPFEHWSSVHPLRVDFAQYLAKL